MFSVSYPINDLIVKVGYFCLNEPLLNTKMSQTLKFTLENKMNMICPLRTS